MPPRSRGRFIAWPYTIPFVLVALLGVSAGPVFTVVALATVVCLVDVPALGPRTTGRPVDADPTRSPC